jgi:hypothetical protein
MCRITTDHHKVFVETSKMISARKQVVVLSTSTSFALILIRDSATKDLIAQSSNICLHVRKHVIRKLCYDYLYGFCKDGPDCKMIHVKLFQNRDVRNELKFTEQFYKLLKETGPYAYCNFCYK